MKAIAAVTAGGKTTLVNALAERLPASRSLHFDDYTFEGEVEDFRQWELDGMMPLEDKITAMLEIIRSI